MADRRKTIARTLQAETGWSYMACRNALERAGWDYDKALAEIRQIESRSKERR